MSRTIRLLALISSAVLIAAIAGFFYAYSVSAIWGLDAVDPAVAIRAMQGINATVRNIYFAPAFFGALVIPAITALAYLAHRRDRVAFLVLAAAIIYGLGGFALTLWWNVPLNEALAQVAISSDAEAMARIWRDYRDPWMIGNHIRTILSFAALVLLLVALTMQGSQSRAAR